MTRPLYQYSATKLHDAFKSGSLSAREIIAYFLKRIDAFDPQIRAFLAVFHEQALANADALDAKKAAGKPLGKLAGVPIALKDNMHKKGELTTCASRILENYRAPYDATITKLIEEEDGIIIGKTNLDEFAMGSATENSAFFHTHNPWNLDYNPGGSSGGSSAAVSARLVPIALGSDTGGSIRQPAAFTSTVGFKPTYGRVSRYGLVAFASSLDQIGPITNSLEDCALMMEVMGKHCRYDSTSLPLNSEPYLDELKGSVQGKKVGIPIQSIEHLDEAYRKTYYEGIEILKNLGADVCEIDLNIKDFVIPTYYVLSTAEASTNLARFDGIRYGMRASGKSLEELYKKSRGEGFGPEVKQRILLGTFVLSAGFQDAYYKKAQKIRTLILREYAKAFKKCDVIVGPTSPGASFRCGSIQDPLSMYYQDLYTIPANLAGLPAINVPLELNYEEMPIGFQFTGPLKEDARVMRFAKHFLDNSPMRGKVPPLFDKETS